MESLKKLNDMIANFKTQRVEPVVNDNLPRDRELRALVALFGARAFNFAWKRGMPINEVTDGHTIVAFVNNNNGFDVYDCNVLPTQGNGYLASFNREGDRV
jgi:hypothetical protein